MNLQHLHSFGNPSLWYGPTRPVGDLLEMSHCPARPEAGGFWLATQRSQSKHHIPSFTLFWTRLISLVGQGAACKMHLKLCFCLTIPPTRGRSSPRLPITQNHSWSDHKVQFDCGISRDAWDLKRGGDLSPHLVHIMRAHKKLLRGKAITLEQLRQKWMQRLRPKPWQYQPVGT